MSLPTNPPEGASETETSTTTPIDVPPRLHGRTAAELRSQVHCLVDENDQLRIAYEQTACELANAKTELIQLRDVVRAVPPRERLGGARMRAALERASLDLLNTTAEQLDNLSTYDLVMMLINKLMASRDLASTKVPGRLVRLGAAIAKAGKGLPEEP